MTGRARVAVIAASALAFILDAPIRGQRFTSRSELVLVDVLVTEDRRIVTGLKADDFQVLDSDVPQTVQQLYLEQLPLDLVMVLDTSGSVKGERLVSLKKAAGVVVDRLRPGDRAALVSFSARLDLEAPLTGDHALLHQAIGRLEARGSTALLDASLASLLLRGGTSRRTLILLFSDGVDTVSLFGRDRVLQIARRSDATVYAVGMREETPRLELSHGHPSGVSSSNPYMADERFLATIAEETGGRLLFAQRNRQLAQTFARVIEEYNSRYVLGYVPAGVSGGGWHPVRVRLTKRRGTVLARRGYYAD